jgi:hypothetical protein
VNTVLTIGLQVSLLCGLLKYYSQGKFVSRCYVSLRAVLLSTETCLFSFSYML